VSQHAEAYVDLGRALITRDETKKKKNACLWLPSIKPITTPSLWLASWMPSMTVLRSGQTREGHDLVVLMHKHTNNKGVVRSFYVSMLVAEFLPWHGGCGGAALVLLISCNLERTQLNTGQRQAMLDVGW
jgi:hypothetical protein